MFYRSESSVCRKLRFPDDYLADQIQIHCEHSGEQFLDTVDSAGINCGNSADSADIVNSADCADKDSIDSATSVDEISE